eukprot:jgi/Tetstr1/446686/TSEL_003625.t1
MPRRWTAWAGVSSCVVAGALMAVSQTAGRRARLLREALEVARLADLASLASLVPLVIAVTGRVFCANPIKCEDGATEAAIVNATEQEHFLRQVENGNWKHEKATVFNSTREVPWSLDDGSGVQLEVANGRDATNLAHDLTTIYDQYQQAGKTLFQHASDHIQGMRSLGIRRTERVLPVGTAVTAVGELAEAVPRPGGGLALVLRRPSRGGPFYLTTKSLPELVESLSTLSRLCRVRSYTLSSPFPLMGGCPVGTWHGGLAPTGVALLLHHVTSHLLEERRRRKLRARVQERRHIQPAALMEDERQDGEGGADGEEAVQRDREANICVVCLERPLDAVFAKCGHMCCCIDCASRLNQCPVCRRHTDVIRVFLP